MKDLTLVMPDWYKEKNAEYENILKNNLHRKNINLLVYSKIVNKVIVEAYNWGGDDEIYGIYDFDKNEFHQIGSDMLTMGVTGGASSWDKKFDGSFVYFELSTGHTNKYGEFDETYKLVIDSHMNNAPNLTGKDVFDKSFRTACDILYDFLYFEYKGIRYLIDGDYNILAKFPKKIDIIKNKYVKDNTKQFILQDGKKWCLYDIEEKKIIINDIVSVSNTSSCDFRLGNGDIYIYDGDTGKFMLLSKYDNFCDELEITLIYIYGSEHNKYDEKNNRDLIYILKDKKGKFYIRHNNKVINKNCPFDKVELKKEYFESENRFICRVVDIYDIYDGYDKFKFNTLNINGDEEDEKLWFDKD